NNVLVAGQHKPLRSASVTLPANIDLLLDDLRLFIGFNRPPVEMQTRFGHFFLRLAKAQLDGEFVRLHGIDRLEKPEADNGCTDQEQNAPIAAAFATATGEDLLQTVLALAQNILEIRWSVLAAATRTFRSLSPWAAI